MTGTNYPPEWDEERVRRVLTHYENQTEEGAFEEDEALHTDSTRVIVEIPVELMPLVRELIGQYKARATS